MSKTTTNAGLAAKAIGAFIVAAVILIGIVLGGWQAGWWFAAKNADRDAHVRRSTYGYQQTLREQITKGIGDVTDMDRQIAGAKGDDVTSLTAQRRAIANQVCGQAEQITGDPLPADQASWVSQNCVMGSAK